MAREAWGGLPESAGLLVSWTVIVIWRVVNGLMVVGREFRGPGGAERRLARKLPPSIDQESPGWPRIGFRERARNGSAAQKGYRIERLGRS